MNNNLINFINEKMNKLYKKQMKLSEEIIKLDIALCDNEFVNQLTLDEYSYGLSLIFNKEAELEYVKKQYKNLNTIRLHALGLI